MRKSKFIVIALALVLLVGSAFALTAMAEDAATPTLKIASKNLSYEDNIKILFAVKAENTDGADVKLNFYEADPADNAGLTPVVLSAAYTPDNSSAVGIAGHYVFFTPGLAAKFMSKQIFVQATATVNGTEYKSEVARYSVVEYCHEMIAKESTDAAKDAKFMDVIEYGAAIQSFLTDDGKYNGALATDYKYVTIDDGTLDGRYNAGIYLPAQTVKPTIDGATKLVTDTGAELDNGAEYTIGNSNVHFKKFDVEKALATMTFDDGKLPTNMIPGNTYPTVVNLTNSYALGSTSISQWPYNKTTTCYWLSNQENNKMASLNFTESAEAAQGADMVEFESDMLFYFETNYEQRESFNFVLADENGNVAINIILQKLGANLQIYYRDSNGAADVELYKLFLEEAHNQWFNFRVTYKYVDASTIDVDIYCNGTLIGNMTKPYSADAAISAESITNAYIVTNGRAGQTMNFYFAIDNVVFRKIAE